MLFKTTGNEPPAKENCVVVNKIRGSNAFLDFRVMLSNFVFMQGLIRGTINRIKGYGSTEYF
jgi:hypothetical protein